MAYLVPLVLGGLALAVMAIVSASAHRKKRQSPALHSQARILIHAINDDRCTGCDACVAVCPTNVLDLVSNKSRVLRFEDCIQCEACMWACPTEALVMFPEGTYPPPIRAPEIDDFYQTMVPGQYLIGEVAGKPLVKNAANLGRAVVEHMLHTGLQPSGGGGDLVDVLIVGSGPGGLSAALSCHQRGLSYLVIEKENIISSTVSRYPKGKHFMAEPYETPNYSLLPVFDSTKEELVAVWQEMVKRCELRIKMHETVQTVQKQADGSFVTASTGGHYRSQRVVLATGTRGKPRALGVQGENYPKVLSLLEDPDEHRGKAVCVIGGGDSALEAALALGDAGAKVIVSYRGASFHRAQAKNRKRIERGMAEGRIKVKLKSEIAEFGEHTVTLQMSDGTQKRYPNEVAFVLIGADPPVKWLATLGVQYSERPHMQPMPASDVLVKQFVPSAQPCPSVPSLAAGLVLGRPIAQEEQPAAAVAREPVPPPRASAGRRFIASATSLLGMSRLGEGRNRSPSTAAHFLGPKALSTRSKRDELEPQERTRILRMLRDEGGRHADEDSQLFRVDELLAKQESHPPKAQSKKQSSRRDPFAKAPNEVMGGFRTGRIVGFTEADQHSLEVDDDDDEHTAHMTPEEAQEMLRTSASTVSAIASSTSISVVNYSDNLSESATQIQVIADLSDDDGQDDATRVTSLAESGLLGHDEFALDKTTSDTTRDIEDGTLDDGEIVALSDSSVRWEEE